MNNPKLLFAALVLGLISSVQYTQIGQRIEGDAGSNDNMGWAVAVNGPGNMLAVGAPLFDNDFGRVRVYQESNGALNQVGGDIVGDEIGDQLGFSLSLNHAGDRLSVGGLSGLSSPGGQAHVFAMVNNQWQALGDPILGEASGDQFGFSSQLSRSGDVIVVGAPKNDGAGIDAGHVRVFQLVSGAWTQIGDDIDGGAAGDSFGTSVAISADGNTIIVGAPNSASSMTGAGQIRAYTLSNGTWTQLGSEINGQTENEIFGFRVDISADGTRLIGSAPLHDHGNGFGSVRVYELSGGEWAQLGGDLRSNSNTEAYGQGLSISLDGQRIAIGTQSNDDVAMSSGSVDTFMYDSSTWTSIGPRITGSAQFDQVGKSVSLNENGSRLGIGANLADATAGYAVLYGDGDVVTSNEDELPRFSVSVYPNPAFSSLWIENSAEGFLNARIYDLSGRLVLTEELRGASLEKIDLSTLVAGSYLIELNGTQKRETSMFSLQR